MTQNSGISKAEGRSLAVASATLGPWRAASVVGALGGAVSLGIGTIADGIGAGVVAGALSVTLTLFFVVGGAGAVLGRRGGAGSDHRIRRWAAAHPWRVAAVPAALMAFSDVVVRQLVGSESFFTSVGDGLWRGVVVGGVVGLVGRYGGGRR
ncbi:hypothetical protein [Streptomyces beijiangensis]|uniref:Uncharacterized protein n=1 Tax=Streptomyces beijiangensis TaxID=163361 RepID=A0A939F4B0_9ACTN|nr:hypothetical protein [Streptomyces beijiangensis]MBO0511433.1 hypothetical protein [Streptomyces beijiangensis]